MENEKVLDNVEAEEFLTPEELQKAEGNNEGNKPIFGNVDLEYQDQDNEDILQVKEVSGFKYKIVNNVWANLAKALWKRYKELQECNPSTLLFVETDGKAKYRGKPKIMETSVISARWSEILKQVSNKNFTHVITIYRGNIDKYEQNQEQMLIHLYIAMRQIKADGSLRDFDIRAFNEVYASLRVDWDKEHTLLPNLIEVGNWLGMHRLQGQLFGEDRTGENEQVKNI